MVSAGAKGWTFAENLRLYKHYICLPFFAATHKVSKQLSATKTSLERASQGVLENFLISSDILRRVISVRLEPHHGHLYQGR